MPRTNDTAHSLPVQLLALSASPPVISPARLTCATSDSCQVTLDPLPPGLTEGLGVVLDCREQSGFRVVGRIAQVDGNEASINVTRILPEDQRSFPRVMGGVRLRYTWVSDATDQQLQAWVADAIVPEGAPRDWSEPDPFMDVSASGLAFEDHPHCPPGGIILLEFRLPPYEQAHRATGRVVRVAPLPEEERRDRNEGEASSPTHDVAIHFEDLSPGALDALMGFTLRMQSIHGEE